MTTTYNRDDYVPAAPIHRALNRWLTENGLRRIDAVRGAENGAGVYYSPYEILVDRTGLAYDTIHAHAQRQRWKSMQFDVADALLCAIDQPNLWWQDPELCEVYEVAVAAADKVRPITEEAMLERAEMKAQRARERERAYREKNAERFRARKKENYHKNKDKINAEKRAARRRQKLATAA